MSLTDHVLSKRLADRSGYGTTMPNPQNPVNTMWSLQNDLILPGKFYGKVDHRMLTAPQRQARFFQERAQPLAQFLTRRVV